MFEEQILKFEDPCPRRLEILKIHILELYPKFTKVYYSEKKNQGFFSRIVNQVYQSEATVVKEQITNFEKTCPRIDDPYLRTIPKVYYSESSFFKNRYSKFTTLNQLFLKNK